MDFENFDRKTRNVAARQEDKLLGIIGGSLASGEDPRSELQQASKNFPRDMRQSMGDDFRAISIDNLHENVTVTEDNPLVEKWGKRGMQRGEQVADEWLASKGRLEDAAYSMYVRESQRLAALERSGAIDRREALRQAAKNLSEQGITTYSYTRKDGRVVSVPIDVGIRRAMQTNASQMLRDQTIEVANELGENLVEVSVHSGARISHAVWQGKIYQLQGAGKYPNFYKACHVGDMVEGFGGYNCYHVLRIYREGSARRWQMPDNGYTNEEAYALKQTQRAIENNIRKSKREALLLNAMGLDPKPVNAQVRAYQAQLRQLIDENQSLLKRERWRELVYNKFNDISEAYQGIL